MIGIISELPGYRLVNVGVTSHVTKHGNYQLLGSYFLVSASYCTAQRILHVCTSNIATFSIHIQGNTVKRQLHTFRINLIRKGKNPNFLFTYNMSKRFCWFGNLWTVTFGNRNGWDESRCTLPLTWQRLLCTVDPSYVCHSDSADCAIEVVIKKLHGKKTQRINIRNSRPFTFGWVCADDNLLFTYLLDKTNDGCIAELTKGGQA